MQSKGLKIRLRQLAGSTHEPESRWRGVRMPGKFATHDQFISQVQQRQLHQLPSAQCRALSRLHSLFRTFLFGSWCAQSLKPGSCSSGSRDKGWYIEVCVPGGLELHRYSVHNLKHVILAFYAPTVVQVLPCASSSETRFLQKQGNLYIEAEGTALSKAPLDCLSFCISK